MNFRTEMLYLYDEIDYICAIGSMKCYIRTILKYSFGIEITFLYQKIAMESCHIELNVF